MPDSKKHQSENTQNEGILAPVDQANLPEEEGTKSTSETSENKNATDISVKTSRVKCIVMELSKAGNVTFNENERLYSNKPIKIAMEKKGSDKKINTLVALSFNEQEMNERGLTIRTSKQLAPFDRIILDAITTLYVEGGNEYITLAMIFNVITGDPNKRMHENFEREIYDSITKMMYTSFHIEANEEACMYKELKGFKYDGYLLPAERISAKLNGTITTCIHLFRTPPLYDYANRKKQIGRVSLDIIAKPFQAGTRESTSDAVLTFFLTRRIIALGHLSNKILYETVYEELGYKDSSPKVKFTLRKKIKEILTSWENVEFGNIRLTGHNEIKKSGIPYEIELLYEYIKK